MPEPSGKPPSLSWREELRLFLEVMRRTERPIEQAREEYGRILARTLREEVYPAFEEFLGEMTRHGVGGQIYGRDTTWMLTLRLDDGFEVAVERDRYREQAQLLPRLIFVVFSDEGGRRYYTTQGIAWDTIRRQEVLARVVDEYKRWYVQRTVWRETPEPGDRSTSLTPP
ncbi:MAG TPA: hypothetical protein VNO23_19395 [Candidatus Binatia bacterium]|nr:hypothetical protein [Candidatus Binatia bacterium]